MLVAHGDDGFDLWVPLLHEYSYIMEGPGPGALRDAQKGDPRVGGLGWTWGAQGGRAAPLGSQVAHLDGALQHLHDTAA